MKKSDGSYKQVIKTKHPDEKKGKQGQNNVMI